MAQAQADAMRAAASNEGSGPMGAFMGMGFATGAGGMTSGNLFAQAEREEQIKREAQAQAQPAAAPAGSWTCSCGAVNSGRFCMECGKPKPEDGWSCSCGAVNKGKFCSECGKPKPAGAPLYKCDKCGWEPDDPTNPPKFCPECGDIFDENDIK